MMMRKFIAATSREAMQKMKAALGPDAYVISNRKIAQGIEIMAMVGDVAPESPLANGGWSAGKAAFNPAASPGVPNGLRNRSQTNAAPARTAAPMRTLRDIAVHLPPTDAVPGEAAGGRTHAERAPAMQAKGDPAELASLMDEVRSMRSLFESHMVQMAGQASQPARPLGLQLLQRLLDSGFSEAVARSLISRMPDDYSAARAEKWLQDVLAHNLRCTPDTKDLVTLGGTYALIGPTGVGKTTTTAKLAARCVVKFGADALGLITTDSYRIGAFDQLATYGRILGVPVHTAHTAAELREALTAMGDKHLVLIDTAGMSQRDPRVREHLRMLDLPQVRPVVLLNAAAQRETLDDVLRSYGSAPAAGKPRAAVLTKLDEAVKLAPALDLCMRHGIELAYVSTGQRVPEDLHGANARVLVHKAWTLPEAQIMPSVGNLVLSATPAAPPSPGRRG